MSRKEDFKKAAADYVDGEPDGAQKIVGQVSFEFGAEYGYQYAKKKLSKILGFELDFNVADNPNWQQVRMQAAIAAMQGMLMGDTAPHDVALSISAVELADALVEELKRSDDVYAECRRMDAINTASVCENMTKIQKELQKKGGER